MQTEPTYGLPYLEDTDPVEDLAAQTKAIAEGIAAVVAGGDFQGPQGEPGAQGEPGLPGVNAVPADDAVAEYLTTTGSAARGALLTAVSDGVGDALPPAVDAAVTAALAALTTRVAALEQPAPVWTAIPLAAGVTAERALYTRVKLGGVWWVFQWLRGVKIPSGTAITKALPAGHAPADSVIVILHNSTALGTIQQAWVSSDQGIVKCNASATGATTWHVHGLIAYPVLPLPA